MEEIDIWRSAQQMIEAFGEEAINACVRRIDKLRREGDQTGMDIWAQIIVVVHKLNQRRPCASESLNTTAQPEDNSKSKQTWQN